MIDRRMRNAPQQTGCRSLRRTSVSAETERKTHTHSLQNTMPTRFDAAPYGVYRWAGGQPPGVTQPDNGSATMGRGQWHTSITREIRSIA